MASEAFLGEDHFRDRAELSMAGVLVTGKAAGRVREHEGRIIVRVFVPGSSALSQSFDFPVSEATEETVSRGIQQGLDSQAQW